MGVICSGFGVLSRNKAESGAAESPSNLLIATMHPAWREKSSEKITRQMSKMTKGEQQFNSASDYNSARNRILHKEAKAAFDWDVHENANDLEKEVVRIVGEIRKLDVKECYRTEIVAEGYSKLPGGHFLGNIDIINKSQLFKVAQAFPKGAHLHCHFNSCLPPQFLIRHARDIRAMWIKSTCSLATPEGKQRAEIQFQVHEEPRFMTPPQEEGDLLDEHYHPGAWMRYSQFRTAFAGDEATEDWLCQKMLLNEAEVYGVHQTVVE